MLKKFIHWCFAIFLSAPFIIFVIFSLDLIREKLTFPYDIFLIVFFLFFIMPIEDLMCAKLNNLLGFYKYYSKLLIGVNNKKKNLLILHNTTLLDYVFLYFNYRKQEKRITSKLVLSYFLKGLLEIINQVEKNIISENTVIIGTSYFFNERNMNKLGFTIIKLKKYYYFKFIMSYLNIILKHLLIKHNYSFPNIFRIKTAVITANKLVENKSNIKKILFRIQNNNAISK